jgi:hypothetical protein
MTPAPQDFWRLEFMEAHPRLFQIMADEPELSFGYPLCQIGWRDILDRLCGRIEDALRENEKFEFVRIRQKLGVLRVAWDGEVSDDTRRKICAAVDLSQARSVCTCESCGAEGRRYVNHGWLATACPEHAVGDPLSPKRPGFENILLVRRTPGAPDVYYARYDRETDTLTEVARPGAGPEE